MTALVPRLQNAAARLGVEEDAAEELVELARCLSRHRHGQPEDVVRAIHRLRTAAESHGVDSAELEHAAMRP